jgi:hypothetical protein
VELCWQFWVEKAALAVKLPMLNILLLLPVVAVVYTVVVAEQVALDRRLDSRLPPEAP